MQLDSSDINQLFSSLPDDFTLIVNDKEFKCNRNCLYSWSKTIKSIINRDKNTTKHSLSFSMSLEAVEALIDLIHGKTHDADSFEIYYLGSLLQIDFIFDRYHHLVYKSTNSENIFQRYEVLSNNYKFLGPIILFLNEHKDIYESINNKTEELIEWSLNQKYSFYHSENDKVEFILSRSPINFKLLTLININLISNYEIYRILEHEEAEQYLDGFSLLNCLLNEVIESEQEEMETNEVLNTILSKQNQLIESKAEIERINQQLSINEAFINEVRDRINSISLQLRSNIETVKTISQQSGIITDFMTHLRTIRSMADEVSKLQSEFISGGGAVLYPGTVKSFKGIVLAWGKQVTELEQITQKISLPLDQMGYLINYFEDIANSLPKIIPFVKD